MNRARLFVKLAVTLDFRIRNGTTTHNFRFAHYSCKDEDTKWLR